MKSVKEAVLLITIYCSIPSKLRLSVHSNEARCLHVYAFDLLIAKSCCKWLTFGTCFSSSVPVMCNNDSFLGKRCWDLVEINLFCCYYYLQPEPDTAENPVVYLLCFFIFPPPSPGADHDGKCFIRRRCHPQRQPPFSLAPPPGWTVLSTLLLWVGGWARLLPFYPSPWEGEEPERRQWLALPGAGCSPGGSLLPFSRFKHYFCLLLKQHAVFYSFFSLKLSCFVTMITYGCQAQSFYCFVCCGNNESKLLDP